MPTFADDAASVQDAIPSWLFTITTTSTTYRLTSSTADITYGGNTYTAVTMTSSSVEAPPVGQARQVTISVSIDSAIAQDLLVGGVPRTSNAVRIDIYMARSGAARLVHLGEIASMSSNGTEVQILSSNKIDQKVRVSLPIAVNQRLCQHALYDAGCTIDKSNVARNVVSAVTVISPDGLTVTITSIGGNPDHWARYGYIVRALDGESRSVVDQVGNAITVDVPFRTLAVGNQITVYQGCDHAVLTCRDSFANVINYGGNPLLPTANIFSPVRIGIK